MAWWKIKAYKNNLAKKRREDADGGSPTVSARPVEHPTMETHPGAREKDPETGQKPKPVRKPRVKKPKPPVDETPETPSQPVDPETTDAAPAPTKHVDDTKSLSWDSDE